MASQALDTQAFDELYVVSDLHLGGEPGAQVFDQGALLKDTVLHLATGRLAAARVGLVLNGDLVDFHAEPDARYLDPDGATRKLERIFADPAFQPVWSALSTFVRSPNRRLVIILGHHDVELALPAVRELFTRQLCENDAAARGRLTFVLDGTGYTARVGHARVFCTHGNEVDDWNLVDHEALRRLILALNADTPPPEWTPNAGTRLAVDVLGELRKRFPLAGLFKPARKSALAVLLGLEPALLSRLTSLAPVLLRLVRDMGLRRKGPLSGQEAPEPPRDERSSLELLLDLPSHHTLLPGSELLAQAEAALAQGRTPLELLEHGGGSTAAVLGLDSLRVRSPLENLREALQRWLGKDSTFSPLAPDREFTLLDEAVGPEVDFLVTGHTHLERALKRTRGRGAYFNSGTWSRLLALSERMLSSAEAFQPVHDTLHKGTFAALDAHPHLVLRRPTVVSLWREGGTVHGELRRAVHDDGRLHLVPVPSTRHSLPA